MFIPFQPVSRRTRWGSSPGLVISLMVAFGLVGIYVNLPPLSPPGTNPSRGNKRKKCPRCKEPVLPGPDGYCICRNCFKEFEATEAEDYS
jgi:hypothetical protein